MNKESGTRFAKAAALVGAGALGASILTGVAFAADPTPAPSASSSAESERGSMGHRGPGGHGGGVGGKHGGLLGGFDGEVLHGEATVENDDGTTERVRAVRGEVTQVSADAITVRASDGFSQTYAITADTKIHVGRGDDGSAADIAVGYQAMVAGSITGDSATAKMIGAMSPEDAAEMEQKMAERRAEREQRMTEREQDQASSTES
jgi:hypothetical protein